MCAWMSITLAPEVRGAHLRVWRALQSIVWVLATSAALIVHGPADAEPAAKLVPSSLQLAPAFSLADVHGRRVDVPGPGADTLIVHFFATWCEPCREEFASLAQLSASRTDIRILAISVAEVPSRVRRFAEAEHVPFPILLDGDRAVAKAWGVSVLPTSHVLDDARVPRLLAEGDLDWNHPDVLAALDDLLQARRRSSTNQNVGGRQ